MRVLLLLFFLCAVEARRTNALRRGHASTSKAAAALLRAPRDEALTLLECEAIMMSALAYAPTDHHKVSPITAARKMAVELKKEAREFVADKEARRVMGEEWEEKGRLLLQYSSTARVVRASRDVVAVLLDGDQGKQLAFGFRGTAIAADYAVDVALAANSAPIARLDNSIKFVADTMRRYPSYNYRKGEIGVFGHSLGGFIAEGVSLALPGCVSATIQTGAPIVRRGSDRPRAYPKERTGHRMTVRFIRRGDVVPSGLRHMGGGHNVFMPREPDGPFVKRLERYSKSKNWFKRAFAGATKWVARKIDGLKNHRLENYTPWAKWEKIKKKAKQE